MRFKPEDIDPLLLRLIVDLNNNGLLTTGCCQGRRTAEEFYVAQELSQRGIPASIKRSIKRFLSMRISDWLYRVDRATREKQEQEYKYRKRYHSPEAYVGFWPALPASIEEYARSVGLYVYGGNDMTGMASIRVCSPPGEPGAVVGYKGPRYNFIAESWTKEGIELVIKANEAFGEKMYRVLEYATSVHQSQKDSSTAY
jgi:hypothetical protein